MKDKFGYLAQDVHISEDETYCWTVREGTMYLWGDLSENQDAPYEIGTDGMVYRGGHVVSRDKAREVLQYDAVIDWVPYQHMFSWRQMLDLPEPAYITELKNTPIAVFSYLGYCVITTLKTGKTAVFSFGGDKKFNVKVDDQLKIKYDLRCEWNGDNLEVFYEKNGEWCKTLTINCERLLELSDE